VSEDCCREKETENNATNEHKAVLDSDARTRRPSGISHCTEKGLASLNLFYGAGGKRHAPDPNGAFTFVKEDMQAMPERSSGETDR
jgi:hypothetical protein